jgi:hypothetical protein
MGAWERKIRLLNEARESYATTIEVQDTASEGVSP